jgi:flagellar assembly factor FliW
VEPVSAGLFMKGDTEQGTVNLKSAIVVNEAKFPEFIH